MLTQIDKTLGQFGNHPWAAAAVGLMITGISAVVMFTFIWMGDPHGFATKVAYCMGMLGVACLFFYGIFVMLAGFRSTRGMQ